MPVVRPHNIGKHTYNVKNNTKQQAKAPRVAQMPDSELPAPVSARRVENWNSMSSCAAPTIGSDGQIILPAGKLVRPPVAGKSVRDSLQGHCVGICY